MIVKRKRDISIALSVEKRYENYKKNNTLHHYTAVNAVKYCFRFIKKNICCGIIVPDMNGVSVIMATIIAGKYIDNMKIIKERDDGFDFKNNISLRVMPRVNENIASILLGEDYGNKIKIIEALAGDPQMNKFNDIMGFD